MTSKSGTTLLIRILFVVLAIILQSSLPQSPSSAYAYYYLSTLAGPLIAGLAVYLILSYLFVPLRVTIPLAMIMSVLIFGLAKYYSANNDNYDNYKDKSRKVATTKAAKSSYSTVPSNLGDIELEEHLLQQGRQQVIDQREESNYINKRDSIISNKNNNNNYTWG